ILALALLASGAAPSAGTDPIGALASRPDGEPLPAGAPTDDYQLTAWCYGALGEYLEIYDRVKPDLRAIDKLFGSSVRNEAEPYHQDIAAARVELKVFADAVEAAEKASAQPIAQNGAAAIKQGRSIWSPAETKTRRELARAWLSWGLPDRCDTTARALASRSSLLGQALTYNNGEATAQPAPDADTNAAPSLKPIEPGPSDPELKGPESAAPPATPPSR
ncbi:MAG TPA: hypothetical protein VFC47_00070, partial [Caulobacteraceae bacterium]|nr:hypothetical protein [Caulobacteraceae bacterium]